MAYTNSGLVTYKKISPNRNTNRNHAIDTITIHCIVGQWTAKQGCDFFYDSSVQASANYVVGKDGSIGLCVEEKDRSWCSSSSSNDNRAVTIEVASDTKHPYAVTDQALSALIKLVADICERNNIKELKWKADKSLVGQVDKQNMTVHKWFANKDCPGEHLYNKHYYIASEVNKILSKTEQDEEKTEEPVKPSVSDTNEKTFNVGDIVDFSGGKHYVSASATSGSTVKASKAKVTAVSRSSKHPYHVRAVNNSGAFISGVYGWVDANTLSAIKENSSLKPSQTTSEISIVAGTKLNIKSVPLYVSSTSKSMSSKITGTYYVWDKNVINNRIRITNSAKNVGNASQVTGWINYSDARNAINVVDTTTGTVASTKTLDDWAREVISGKHGNGMDNRRASLKKAGCPYTAEQVQDRVNELL